MKNENYFQNKNILITGGAGSIGKTILEKVIKYNINSVRIMDNSEQSLLFLKQKFGRNKKIQFSLGDVTNYDDVAIATFGIHIIFHCAAFKNITISEDNPIETVRTNIFGTYNIANAAVQNNVKQVVHMSSDKVVYPTSIQGATKLIAEKIINLQSANNTKFCSIRFGNVLGSNGSIIHTIKNQVAKGDKPYITDKKMTRFILSLDKISEIAINMAVLEISDKIIIPKMDSVLVEDMIKATVEIFTKSKIELEEKGIREGEKLYEELITNEEMKNCKDENDIIIISKEFESKTEHIIRSDKSHKLNYGEITKVIQEIILNSDI